MSKKNIIKKTLHCFCLLLLICAGLPASAQAYMQAANDSIFVATGTRQIAIANVLANDVFLEYDQGTNTYISTPATFANATISQIATDNPLLDL